MVDGEVTRKPVIQEGWNFLTGQKTFSSKNKFTFYHGISKIERYFNDAVLRYENKFFKKNLAMNFMLGASQELYRSKDINVTKQDLIDLSMSVLDGATGQASANGGLSEWAMRSYFSRLNLNWQDRYLMEFNLRADGSSRFQKSKRWGYFPSLSAAWRMDQEKFMEGAFNGQLSNLKLRVSYGSLGNNAVGNYASQSLYTSKKGALNYVLGNTMVTGMAQTALANEKLSWETTNVFDLGFDFGFFKNKLTGTFDYFNKRTTDILIDLPAPAVHGTTSLPKVNSATVTNQGVEFTLGWQDRVNEFSYGATANFTFIKNKVNKFKGKDKGGMAISGANLIWEGHSINSQYLLRVERLLQTDEDMKRVQEIIDNAPIGADGKKVNPFAAFGTPKKGDLLYKDVNGDGIIDEFDRVKLGNSTPWLTGGFSTSLTWKDLSLSIRLDYAIGHTIVDTRTPWIMGNMQGSYNTITLARDNTFSESNPNAKYPRYMYADQLGKGNYDRTSTLFTYKGDYLAFREISLSYRLPQRWTKKIAMNSVDLSLTAQNLGYLTAAKYVYTPEPGGDTWGGYSLPRIFVFGLNVGL